MSATAPQIIPERLAALTTLKRGSHDSPDKGMCAMEAVAFVAGEPHSDSPKCASPVIATFARAWNDGMSSDEERAEFLLPVIARMIGTRGSKALEERRSLMAADWLVRVHTPAWLRLAGLTAQADRLAGLPEITSMAQVPSMRPAIEAARDDAAAAWDAARDAARAAAWAAAGDAAWDAAWAAARAAAWAAAGDAAWAAAWDAAWDAAGDAAWDAAWAAAGDAAWAAAGDAAGDAAWAAAGDALADAKRELQLSARDLLVRMCDAGDDKLAA